MRIRRRAAAAGTVVAVSVATVMTFQQPVQAATTATAWVTSFAVYYEAGSGQSNAVTVKKAVNSAGTWWQFTDVVPITAGAGCYHPYRGATLVWCSPGSAQVIGVLTGDLDDHVAVESPNTVVHAGAGNDVVRTVPVSSMSTIVYGDDGSDTIISEVGRDTINGGPGLDTISYATRNGAIYAALVTNSGGPLIWGGHAPEDTYTGIENLTGGWADDVLFGDAGPNNLDGGPGRDSLLGGDGSDLLVGGSGNDGLWGDGGNDVLFGQDGDDTLWGFAGTDTFDGGPAYDQCYPQIGEQASACEYVLWV